MARLDSSPRSRKRRRVRFDYKPVRYPRTRALTQFRKLLFRSGRIKQTTQRHCRRPLRLWMKRPTKKQSDTYVYRRLRVTDQRDQPKTSKERARAAVTEEKLKAIAQVLASFGLIDRLTKKEQESLLLAIHRILEEREE
jgi:hypothetical protein